MSISLLAKYKSVKGLPHMIEVEINLDLSYLVWNSIPVELHFPGLELFSNIVSQLLKKKSEVETGNMA